MNKLTFGLTALLMCTSLGFASPLSSAAAEQRAQQAVRQDSTLPPSGTRAEIRSSSLSDAVNRFVQELSKQQGFEQWARGTWTSYPLGPGTHGWVILISDGGKEIGYLVLHSSGPDSYRLSEYGQGEFPLYGMQTLHRSLVRLELLEYPYQAERLYFSPLQALWKISVQGADRQWYLDAKTGEELPFSDDSKLPKQGSDPEAEFKPFTNTESAHTIKEAGQTVPSEPNRRLPWVLGKPQPGMTAGRLKQWIDEARKPIFSAELYAGTVILPLSVSGYQVWTGGSMFVEVVQDDDRYLPYEALAAAGGFYP